MKKLVLKISMPDEEAKRKALKTVAAFPGIDSISVDMKDRKMVIIGTVDPTKVVSRLRKYWTTELLTVGPAKEPEVKKEEPKKDEAASGGDKKPAGDHEGGKKENQDKKQPVAEEAKKEEGKQGKKAGEGEAATGAKTINGEVAAAAGGGVKKVEAEEKKVDPVLEMVRAYRAYNPHMTKYYYAQSMEENPNACVIC